MRFPIIRLSDDMLGLIGVPPDERVRAVLEECGAEYTHVLEPGDIDETVLEIGGIGRNNLYAVLEESGLPPDADGRFISDDGRGYRIRMADAGVPDTLALIHGLHAYRLAERQRAGDSDTARYADVDVGEAECQSLTPGWHQSAERVADLFHETFDGRCRVFHRNSDMVAALNRVNARLSENKGIRRWTPADIWAVDAGMDGIPSGGFSSLADFIGWLEESFDAGRLIGISLPGSPDTVTEQRIFAGPGAVVPVRASYTGYNTHRGSSDFFAPGTGSGAHISYVSDGVRSEIGLGAIHSGLCGWGADTNGRRLVGSVLDGLLFGDGVPPDDYIDQMRFREMAGNPDESVLGRYVDMYLSLNGGERRRYRDLMEAAAHQRRHEGPSWFYSKYLSVQFLHHMIRRSAGQDLVERMIEHSISGGYSVPFVGYG